MSTNFLNTQSNNRTIPGSTKISIRTWCLENGLSILPVDQPWHFGQNLIQSESVWRHLSVGMSQFPLAMNHAPIVFLSRQAIPTGRSIFFASSSLGHSLEKKAEWFDAMRTRICRLSNEHFLITESSTTADKYVRRAACLFGVPIVRLLKFPNSRDMNFDQAPTNDSQETMCYYSTIPIANVDSPMLAVDKLLAQMANEVFILSAKNNGRTVKAVLGRLESTRNSSNSQTSLLLNHTLTNRKTQNVLLDAGATAWLLFGKTKQNNRLPNSNSQSEFLSNPVLMQHSSSDSKFNDFLLHWTRRAVGPWPDLTPNENLDDLIFQNARSDHTAIETLCRILASGRLIASNHLLRSKKRVVCFTELSLKRLRLQNRFRPHLARWDFMPFGIGIRKSLLCQFGAKPVIYGDEGDWKSMDSLERPFYQNCTPELGGTDWTIEKEWRIVDDLILTRIRPEDAFVFVPSIEAAQIARRLSRWPVVAFDSTNKISVRNEPFEPA